MRQDAPTPSLPPSAGPPLVRIASRWQIVGLAINDVVGSGVYLLPAAAAALLGPSSFWAVAVAGLAVLLVVLCFAEASSYFDQPGSAYLYARTAFGDLVGFEVGWMTWLTRVASLASLIVAFAQAVSYLEASFSGGLPRALLILGTLAGLTAVNVVGVRSGIWLAVFLAVAKLVPLFLFVVVGLPAFSRSLAASQTAVGGSSTAHLGQAALLLLYAYAGFENTPAAAGEYRNPRRDVPFALLTQLGLVTLLYMAVQGVALGTVPDLAASDTPLADGAGRLLGSWGGWLLTAGAAVSILGTTGNTVLAGPRYLWALARDGYGPRYLARVHPRFRTPAAAILTQSLLALPLALTGTFVELATLSVVARLVTYLGTAAALPVLRRQRLAPPGLRGRTREGTGPAQQVGGTSPEREAAAPFRLPGGVTIPVLAALVTLGLGASAEPRNLIAAVLALVVGLGVYALRRR